MTTPEQATVTGTQALFLLENHALGVNGSTVTATSEQTTGSLTVDNLLSPDLDTAFRSGSLAALNDVGITEIIVRFNLGTGRTVRTVATGASNVRVPWRTKFYNSDPTSSPAEFESALTDSIVRGRMDEFTWLEMPWDLGPRHDDLELWTETFRLRSIIVADRDYFDIQYVDLVFSVTDENQNLRFQGDFLQFGTAIVSDSLQTRINIVLGWGLGVNDLSETHRVEGGGMHGRHRAKLTTLGFTFGFLERDEAYRKIFRNMKTQGELGRLFVWVEPQHPADFYWQSMIATATTLPKITMAHLNWPAANGWQLTETE